MTSFSSVEGVTESARLVPYSATSLDERSTSTTLTWNSRVALTGASGVLALEGVISLAEASPAEISFHLDDAHGSRIATAAPIMLDGLGVAFAQLATDSTTGTLQMKLDREVTFPLRSLRVRAYLDVTNREQTP
jgi:hypothetical protein